MYKINYLIFSEVGRFLMYVVLVAASGVVDGGDVYKIWSSYPIVQKTSTTYTGHLVTLCVQAEPGFGT